MDTDLLETLVHWVRTKHFGKYRGTVVDSADTTNRGRLKVRVPAALGDLEVWAMPCVPYAGDKAGFYFLPEAKTGVWVEFEAGEISNPIWTGFFWADDELPADAKDASTKVIRTLKSVLVVDDSTPGLRLAADDGGEVTIADEVKLTRDQASQTVATGGVTSAISSQKIEITSSSVSIDGGALEVK